MKFQWIFVVISMGIIGCGGKMLVKQQPAVLPAVAVASPIPTSTPGLQAPALVDFHIPVSDVDYQMAVSAVGETSVNGNNVNQYLTIAQYQYNHFNHEDALKTYQKILLVTNAVPQMDKAQYMVGQVFYDQKDYLPALAAFQNVLEKFPMSAFVSQSHQMMDFILGYCLSLEDLKNYVANYPDTPLRCSALFQLASHESQSGFQGDAVEHLNEFIQQCPQHPSVAAAQLLLQSLQSQQQGKSWKIGILVPLSGRLKTFGNSVLNGITLAIQEANKNGGSQKPMRVVVEDTGSEGLRAVTEFENMIKDDSLDAVIGPVSPADISAVAVIANEHHIPMICPAESQDGISNLGPYLFSNSMTNEMQGRAIAKFAMEHLACKQFAVLAPEDGYGETLAGAFRKTVEAAGGTLTASQSYPPAATDFKGQLVALGGMDPESSKENDRENKRRLDELQYSIKKEIGKIFLKSRDFISNSGAVSVTTPVIAFVPLVESLSNTICPSVVQDVNQGITESLQDQPDLVIRSNDLVRQALTRLPIEPLGTTRTTTLDQWMDVAQDVQANLIITGQVIEPTPGNDWLTHPTWDYLILLQAYEMDPLKNVMVKIYQGKLIFSEFKPDSMVKANSGYQALYLPSHAAEIPLLVSQVHFYNLNPIFLGGHLWNNETVLQEGGKDLEGAYFVTGFYGDSLQDSVRNFSVNYLRAFAKQPDLLAAQAYDAARLLLRATNNSLSREDIRTNLLAINDFDGVSGKTTFNGHGEADKLVPILKIQNGKFQQVQ